MHGWMKNLQVWVERIVGIVASPRPGECCQQGSDQQHNRGRCHGEDLLDLLGAELGWPGGEERGVW